MPKGQQQQNQVNVEDLRAIIVLKQQQIQDAVNEIDDINRQITLIPSLLKARRDRLAKRHWTPRYSGSVSVVNSKDHHIDDYKLGQQVAFTGFGSVLDRCVARITGISKTPFNATLKLSFNLPTTNRRLQALENDLRNQQTAGR